ncbi:prolyl oligopeptidase family serine peptidase [Candidatus Micrarchaeota archaeon]|nr:prolyl oligopeptidase family serine peptidase [Candidatus Micrarchaeota archaeon]
MFFFGCFDSQTDFLTIENDCVGVCTAYNYSTLDNPVSILLGCSIPECPETAQTASPITHITSDDPPFLILHGDSDKVVPLAQSIAFNEALQDNGVNSSLLIGAGNQHDRNIVTEHMDEILEFFDATLR